MFGSLRARSVPGLLVAAVLLAAPACDKKPVAARPAPALPWQPHGLRTPTLRCDFTVPEGWTRSGSPMPDHLAELTASGFQSQAIIAERVEPDLATAAARVEAYYRSSLLTAAGSKIVAAAPLEGTQGPAQLLSLRWGAEGAGRLETVILVAMPELPLVEIIGRHDEADARARAAIVSLARSLRCAKSK